MAVLRANAAQEPDHLELHAHRPRQESQDRRRAAGVRLDAQKERRFLDRAADRVCQVRADRRGARTVRQNSR